MATEEQAKKEMVAALRALRGILTQRPKQTYPDGLYEHPEVKKVQARIEARVPQLAALDPPGGPYFRDYLPCDVLPLTQLPADWETLKWLDHYIAEFGGTVPADGEVECLVTLQQAAAMVNRNKKTLERCKADIKENMPAPKVSGGGGKPDEWVWSELQPWLEKRFDRTLPAQFPADRFVAR